MNRNYLQKSICVRAVDFIKSAMRNTMSCFYKKSEAFLIYNKEVDS